MAAMMELARPSRRPDNLAEAQPQGGRASGAGYEVQARALSPGAQSFSEQEEARRPEARAGTTGGDLMAFEALCREAIDSMIPGLAARINTHVDTIRMLDASMHDTGQQNRVWLSFYGGRAELEEAVTEVREQNHRANDVQKRWIVLRDQVLGPGAGRGALGVLVDQGRELLRELAEARAAIVGSNRKLGAAMSGWASFYDTVSDVCFTTASILLTCGAGAGAAAANTARSTVLSTIKTCSVKMLQGAASGAFWAGIKTAAVEVGELAASGDTDIDLSRAAKNVGTAAALGAVLGPIADAVGAKLGDKLATKIPSLAGSAGALHHLKSVVSGVTGFGLDKLVGMVGAELFGWNATSPPPKELPTEDLERIAEGVAGILAGPEHVEQLLIQSRLRDPDRHLPFLANRVAVFWVQVHREVHHLKRDEAAQMLLELPAFAKNVRAAMNERFASTYELANALAERTRPPPTGKAADRAAGRTPPVRDRRLE